MTLFRKLPVEIEAWKYEGATINDDGTVAFEGDFIPPDGEWEAYQRFFMGEPQYVVIIIKTLEGDMELTPGNWLIRGVAGEFYPCEASIFEQTYEEVSP